MPPLLDKLTKFLPGQMNPHIESASFCLSRQRVMTLPCNPSRGFSYTFSACKWPIADFTGFNGFTREWHSQLQRHRVEDSKGM